MLAKRYTLNLINQIKFEDSDYELSDEVKNIIQVIASQVGDPEYNRAPAFKKKKQIKNEDFKITKRIEKTGIEALFNKIRINLNKITSSSVKTNESFKDEIAKYILEIKNEFADDWDENKSVINKFIINIICTNHFYSDILVDVFYMIVNDFELQDLLMIEIENRKDFFNELEWFDPNEEYDKFCENNKKNELTRGYVLFLVNIMKKQFITTEYVIDILLRLLQRLNECILLDGYRGVVEEMSELSFILIKNGLNEMKQKEQWKVVCDDINKIFRCKPKDYKGLSNKTMFKFMDINDYILKNSN